MTVLWDNTAKRYRAADGRFISQAAVNQAFDKVREEAKAQTARLAEQLRGGAINLPQWELSMRDVIKATHTYAAAQSAGGPRHMTPADWGRVGAETRKQYAFLANFAREIESGKQPLNGRLAARAAMYVDASRNTAEKTARRQQQGAGATEGRRVLHAMESCPDCVAYAGAGWMPVAEIPAIGDSVCRTNCKCEVIYR